VQIEQEGEDEEAESSPRKGMKNEFDLDLKVVDFGIFGSTSGVNPEKIHAGSLKYMAPEILLGHA
jgi:serine/threonine protein kinase